jgi:hypothetical protein
MGGEICSNKERKRAWTDDGCSLWFAFALRFAFLHVRESLGWSISIGFEICMVETMLAMVHGKVSTQ